MNGLSYCNTTRLEDSNDSCLFSHSPKSRSPCGYQHCQALVKALSALRMATILLNLHAFLLAPRDRQTPHSLSYKDTNPTKGFTLMTLLDLVVPRRQHCPSIGPWEVRASGYKLVQGPYHTFIGNGLWSVININPWLCEGTKGLVPDDPGPEI